MSDYLAVTSVTVSVVSLCLTLLRVKGDQLREVPLGRWRKAPAESSGAARLTRSRSVPFGHWAKPRIKAIAFTQSLILNLEPCLLLSTQKVS